MVEVFLTPSYEGWKFRLVKLQRSDCKSHRLSPWTKKLGGYSSVSKVLRSQGSSPASSILCRRGVIGSNPGLRGREVLVQIQSSVDRSTDCKITVQSIMRLHWGSRSR